MRIPRLGGFLPHLFANSWFGRVQVNLSQLFVSVRFAPATANGAPIHLLNFERSNRARRAQAVSLVIHAAAIATIALIASQTVHRRPDVKPEVFVTIGPLFYSPDAIRFTEKPSLGRKAGGGENAVFPATRGSLPPRSSLQLAPPRLPDNNDHLLPVRPTILDAQAPATVVAQNDVGLPWMSAQTNSAGPGSNGGLGTGKKGGMGDSEGPDAGDGESNDAHLRGVSMPTCLICPYPIYTDEARHVKVQGTVTLRVLVGSDGRATDIRVVRGIGFGLEERAMQTVRGWNFNPARDTQQRTVAAWVTVEAVFRLF